MTGITSEARAGSGNAGSIEVNTVGDLSLVNGSRISPAPIRLAMLDRSRSTLVTSFWMGADAAYRFVARLSIAQLPVS